MMALPLKAIAPATARSKPENEERLGVDIGTSLCALAHTNWLNTVKKI